MINSFLFFRSLTHFLKKEYHGQIVFLLSLPREYFRGITPSLYSYERLNQ